MTFRTAEHMFMFEKAKLMNDEDLMSLIYCADTPREARTYGIALNDYDVALWRNKREDILYKVLLLKTRQHKDVYDALMKTGNSLIAAACPHDRVWAIGLDSEDPKARDPHAWPGKNLLGKAWMKVRGVMKCPTPENHG